MFLFKNYFKKLLLAFLHLRVGCYKFDTTDSLSRHIK